MYVSIRDCTHSHANGEKDDGMLVGTLINVCVKVFQHNFPHFVAFDCASG